MSRAAFGARRAIVIALTETAAAIMRLADLTRNRSPRLALAIMAIVRRIVGAAECLAFGRRP